MPGRRPAASLIAMRIALPRLARFSLFALFLLLPERGFAAYCSSGSELTQDFPSSGAAVSRWHLCWEIVRLPGPDGVTPRSETLAISKAEFRPGATAPSVQVLGDLRMAEIFVPYHPGYPRFHDMSDAAFDLQPISTTECKGTRLGANRLCEEIVDRGLAWRDPYVPTARRGEKLVLWSILY